MLNRLRARLKPPPLTLPDLRRLEPRRVERACARVFATDDGQVVLDHLKAMAFLRCQGSDATEAQLRHAEGQRALVTQLLRLIQAGRNG